MYIEISVECTFEENLLIMSIYHAIAHMQAFWMKLGYKMCCWCASNGLQSTSRHLACRTQLVQSNRETNSQNYVQCGPQVLISNLFILCVHSCWPDVFVNRVIAVCLGCEKQPCLSFNRFFITAWCEKGKQFKRDFVAQLLGYCVVRY